MNARNANRFRPMLKACEDRTTPTVLTPMVSVTSLGDVTEGGCGGMVFTRTVDTSGVLMVNYTVGGTADNSDHGRGTSGTIMFADGVSTGTLAFMATDDSDAEPTEAVTLSLTASSLYNIGAFGTATANILDNETPEVSVTATDTFEGAATGGLTFTRIGDLSVLLCTTHFLWWVEGWSLCCCLACWRSL